MVFCTELLDGRWSWELLCRSCVRCGRCRATTTHPKTRCRKPYAATQHLMLLIMDYVPETCRAKNTSIKLPSYIKLAFHIISWGRCTVKQPSSLRVSSLVAYLFRYSIKSLTDWLINNNFMMHLISGRAVSLNRPHLPPSQGFVHNSCLWYHWKLKSCKVNERNIT